MNKYQDGNRLNTGKSLLYEKDYWGDSGEQALNITIYFITDPDRKVSYGLSDEEYTFKSLLRDMYMGYTEMD